MKSPISRSRAVRGCVAAGSAVFLLWSVFGSVPASAQVPPRLQAEKVEESYPAPPEAEIKEGVPQGTVTEYTFDQSTIFPGTTRSYFIYVPAQYTGEKPACLMVFQDGGGFANRKGQSKAPTVFDNLIHEGAMPVTIGLFVNPGVVPAPNDQAEARYNRSYEYDGMGDLWARFLIEELIPEVKAKLGLNISDDPNDRGLCGSSSGGVAAFTAAWSRPDSFRRVYTIVGTYVGIRGADAYPVLIRRTEPKPLRVFLADGENDNNLYCGDWWMANQTMLRSFEWAGYEVNHVWGKGGHNQKMGAALFPQAMRWLWQDYPKPVTTHWEGAQTEANRFLIDGQDWELVSEGHGFTEGPAVNEAGELFFTDLEKSLIHKVSADGAVSVFAKDTGGTNGLAFGPDGTLYGCRREPGQLVAYQPDGMMSALAEGIRPNDVVCAHDGTLYFTEPGKKTLWMLGPDRKGAPVAVDSDIPGCNGVILSADQSQVFVADYTGRYVFAYSRKEDGTLANKQPYFFLEIPPRETRSQADGMCMDQEGWLVVATAMGVQICDQPGRVHLIAPAPAGARYPSNVTFGGPDGKTLYATCGDKVFKRETRMTGALPWKAPVKPPKPRL